MRLTHIGICVSDWERSLAFYTEALGFRHERDLEVKGEPNDTLLGLRDVELRALYLLRDGVCIELLHYASPGHVGNGAPRPMNALGLTHVSLQVEDLDAEVARLAAHGARVLADTRIENPDLGARAIFVTDPDGTRIELVEMRAG